MDCQEEFDGEVLIVRYSVVYPIAAFIIGLGDWIMYI